MSLRSSMSSTLESNQSSITLSYSIDHLILFFSSPWPSNNDFLKAANLRLQKIQSDTYCANISNPERKQDYYLIQRIDNYEGWLKPACCSRTSH